MLPYVAISCRMLFYIMKHEFATRVLVCLTLPYVVLCCLVLCYVVVLSCVVLCCLLLAYVR